VPPNQLKTASLGGKGDVTLNDLLRVFWRRKLLIVIVTLAVVIPSYVATKLVTKQYESTATIGLIPKQNNLVFFSLLDTIAPYYSDVAASQKTLNQARQLVGIKLCSTSVETFKGTNLMKIHARCSDPRLAQLTAAGVAQALLNRVQNGDVQIRSLDLVLTDPANFPTTPVFPRTKLTLLVAFLLGLGLGLGAALLRESLTTKVESADELAEVTGLPVFAEIPAEAAILKLHSPEDLATNSRLRVVAEALRDLRTNLLFTDESIRSILITSPDGSHGKTTVAFGLAATLARAGTKTLLVDADLRRGRVADLLVLQRSPGLMDVLLDEVALGEAVRHAEDGLDVLVAGRRSADPVELLTNTFPQLLAHLEREYQAVVIDCTPVTPISDARIVARHADATLLVAKAGVAPRRHVRAAMERLDLISVKPTAAVLNYSLAVRGSSYYVGPTGEDEGAGSTPQLSEKRGAVRRVRR
jgi:capsular exopolysaccharide synthesis family protein